MKMRPVFSSHIDSIGHDAATGDLHVAYSGGKTAIYSGVPDDVARTVLTSASIGKALNEHVKGSYPHRYAGEE